MTSRMLGRLAGVLLTVCGSDVAAQSLADVARLEKLRRAALAEQAEEQEEVAKVYTNADLRGGGRLTTAAGGPSAPSSESTAASSVDERADTEGAPADEETWRNRINAVRQAQERAELMAVALQDRIDSLWNDFTSRDDPAQRAVLEQDRQAALDELVDTQSEIEDLTQQVADIRTEARRANVPPGWLR